MPICTPFVDSNTGRITVHTSLSRPTGASLYPGKYIFESDTLRTMQYDGTGWIIIDEPWQTYTPSWTNLTVGNATQTWSYRRTAGVCEVSGSITLGTTSSVGGLIGISVPSGVTAAATATNPLLSFAGRLVPGSSFPPYATLGSTTRVDLYSYNAASAAAAAVLATSATSPGTWASTHIIELSFRYRMNTRYL